MVSLAKSLIVWTLKIAFKLRINEIGCRCSDFIRLIMSVDMYKKSTAALMHSDNITHKMVLLCSNHCQKGARPPSESTAYSFHKVLGIIL